MRRIHDDVVSLQETPGVDQRGQIPPPSTTSELLSFATRGTKRKVVPNPDTAEGLVDDGLICKDNAGCLILVNRYLIKPEVGELWLNRFISCSCIIHKIITDPNPEDVLI